ncbi:methyltransferase [Roseateles saccharophilus]|uniref:Release factor glutamine methyltransferase n=1 Tax=Roseateles saccharophilus TaxID=304 RepID=A0A4V2VPY5_ROSSA|nr:methyltransferase [Roseateles saccharophilus]MDG0833495.1 methyltransferase domain-containing protein [Roseateles saccharophilus]TCU92519.1 release factor glutamine methyltransferase [Roseateles saccharophilus]
MDLASFTDHWQAQRQRLFKSVPPEGRKVRYLDKEFLVYPDTFWPFADSLPLVRHFKVGSGESVLDVGTGSGVIGVFACYRGAGRVVGVDVNPAAIRSATHNAQAHGFAGTMQVLQSNLFEALGDEQFDVITANLPFRNKPAHDMVAMSQWDTDFKTNTGFFEGVGRHLKPKGRIYFVQSNFGEIEAMKCLAQAADLQTTELASESTDETRRQQFFVFEMTRA